MLIIYIIILIIGICALFYAVSQLISIIFGAQYVKTSNEVASKAIEMVNVRPGENFYDIGCGSGRILKFVADNYDVNAIGVEISPLQYLKARILTIDNKNIKIIHKNINLVSLKNADVVFCYLLPPLMKKMEKKFIQELKKGSRVISHSFPLLNKKPSKIEKVNNHTLYLYKY